MPNTPSVFACLLPRFKGRFLLESKENDTLHPYIGHISPPEGKDPLQLARYAAKPVKLPLDDENALQLLGWCRYPAQAEPETLGTEVTLYGFVYTIPPGKWSSSGEIYSSSSWLGWTSTQLRPKLQDGTFLNPIHALMVGAAIGADLTHLPGTALLLENHLQPLPATRAA